MKIVKSLEDSGLLVNGVSRIIENEAKEQSGRFFGILFGTLATSVIGNMLRWTAKISEQGVITAGEGRNSLSRWGNN